MESLDELTRRLDDLLQQAVTPKNSLLDKLRMLPLLAEMSRWLPYRGFLFRVLFLVVHGTTQQAMQVFVVQLDNVERGIFLWQ